MKKILVIGENEFNCEVRKNRNSKKITLTLKKKGSIFLTIPMSVSYSFGFDFIKKNKNWILSQFKKIKKTKSTLLMSGSKKDYFLKKEEARKIISIKLEKFNKFYNLSYDKVFIRNQSTRWGSCSSKNNLNFNYRVVYLRDDLIDYLVVHELCHLAQMNHSGDFWSLVEKKIPNYKELSKELRII